MRVEPETDAFEPIVRGITQNGVRLANERAVLTLIAGRPGVSNADIARRSGLGPQTTARILAELETRELILRGDVLRGRRGQPATPYRLNPRGGYSLGVEIGWQHFEVLLQDMTGQLVAATRRCYPYPYPDPDTVFAAVATDVGTLLAGLTPEQSSRLAGIGVTSPGHFGPLLDRLGAPEGLAARWAKVDFAEQLAGVTNLPTMWVNSGSAAAWREITVHPTPRPMGLASIFVSTFVAGGVVSGGSLLEGPHGNAGDVGAIIVHDRSGGPANLHLVASLHALAQRVAASGLPTPEGPALKWNWAELESHVAAWLEDAGHALAQAVLTTAAMSEVDLVCLNGDLPDAIRARLVESTLRHLARLPVLLAHPPRVVAGKAGPSAAVYGAAQLLLFRRYFSRAWELFEAEPAK
jgi:Transcriptional regulator/sugar kinase